MTPVIYKMDFQRVHFGNGNLNESIGSFNAARLFSALFLEALKMGEQDALMDLATQDDFILSDAFPVIDSNFYLPKPMGYPQKSTSQVSKSDMRELKHLKKVNYIKLEDFDNYINGQMNLSELDGINSKFFSAEVVTRKGIDPYEVGVTSMKSGLYVITSGNELIEKLMQSLSYSGLGGKKTSGYGQFQVEKLSLPEKMASQLVYGKNLSGNMMALTTSIPQANELDKSLHQAHYLLEKASGFAYSTSAAQLLRKQDLFKFKAGSTFAQAYKGEIVDVKPNDFPHPVWNYAKGLFYQFDVK